jgi:hypothetical protein
MQHLRKGPPPWRNPRLLRIFMFEVCWIAGYTLFTLAGWLFWGGSWFSLLTSIALLGIMVCVIIRSVGAYRVGFRMGMDAFQFAMRQPSPQAAAELVARSAELWDPSPSAVAHTMEIERLEKHVNES